MDLTPGVALYIWLGYETPESMVAILKYAAAFLRTPPNNSTPLERRTHEPRRIRWWLWSLTSWPYGPPTWATAT